MPSRHSRKAKSNIDSYGETNKRTPAQSSSVVTIKDTSAPEDILHASWKFIYIYQFLALFKSQLNLPALTIERLESLFLYQPTESSTTVNTPTKEQEDLNNNKFKLTNLDTHILSSASSVSSLSSNKDHIDSPEQRILAKIFVPILASLMEDKKRKTVNENTYQQCIYTYLYNNSLDLFVQDILGKHTDSIDFTKLTIVEKIYVLKDLIDCIFETGYGLIWKNEVDPASMRSFPLGKDSEGWTYWIFGDVRLYREMPQKKKETDYTFELIADNLENWEIWISKYAKKSPKSLDKKLSDNLQEYGAPIVHKFEAKKAAKLREETRLEKARLYELIPRKKSRRIVDKTEEDDKKRQLEEMERAQIEFEILQKEREIREQEEQLESEKQAMQMEESRLREEVYKFIDNLLLSRHHNKDNGNDNSINNEIIGKYDDDDPIANFSDDQLKQLRSKLKKSATYDEMIEKLKGWAMLLDDDYHIYLADEEDYENENKEADVEIEIEKIENVDVTMSESEPIVHMNIDQSNITDISNNKNSNQNQSMDQISNANNDQRKKTESTFDKEIENPIVTENTLSPFTENTSTLISSTPNHSQIDNNHNSTLKNDGSDNKTLSPTTDLEQTKLIINNDTESKNNNDNTSNTNNENVIADINIQPKNNESKPDIINTTSDEAIIDANNKPKEEDKQQTSINNNNIISNSEDGDLLKEPQSNPNNNKMNLNGDKNKNSIKSVHNSKRGRPRKTRNKKPTISKQKALLTFSQVIQFYGNGTRSDLRHPLIKLILSVILSHLRTQPVIIEMEKRNEKKSGKKRKNTPLVQPLDFYTIHKKLLLDLYNDKPPVTIQKLTVNQEQTTNQESLINQEQTANKESSNSHEQLINGESITTNQEQKINQESSTIQESLTSQESIIINQEPKQDSIIKQEEQIINTNEGIEIIEYAAFEKWLYDMDVLFLRNDKPFVEFKKYAYEMFISIFKY